MSVKVEGRFVGPCCSCQSQMWLPEALYVAAKHSPAITFYCPYGHPQIYPAGESTLTLVRRERDRLTQQLAEKDDEINKWKVTARRHIAQSEKQAKTLRRVDKGVCPCCNRSFVALQRHMKTKHPDFNKVDHTPGYSAKDIQ